MMHSLLAEYAECQQMKLESMLEKQDAIQDKLRAQGRRLVKQKAEIRQIQQQVSLLKYAFVSIDDYCESFAKDISPAIKLAFHRDVLDICEQNDFIKGVLDDFQVKLYPVVLLRKVANSALWHSYFENNS